MIFLLLRIIQLRSLVISLKAFLHVRSSPLPFLVRDAKPRPFQFILPASANVDAHCRQWPGHIKAYSSRCKKCAYKMGLLSEILRIKDAYCCKSSSTQKAISRVCVTHIFLTVRTKFSCNLIYC